MRNTSPYYHAPLFLEYNRVDRTYLGGREIDRFRGMPVHEDNYKPEAWVGSTTYAVNRTQEAPDLGLAEFFLETGEKVHLKAFIKTNPAAFLGKGHDPEHTDDTRVLVKLLDSKEQLPLQTHPDGDFARKYFGSGYGKLECWYIVDKRPDAEEEPYVLLGFKPGISKEKFRDLFLAGNVQAMEECCHKIPVKTGDMFFVDTGVPHAIGPGCFVIEVQEPSDATAGCRLKKFETQEELDFYIRRTVDCYRYEGYLYEEILKKYRIAPAILRQEAGGTETLLIGRPHTDRFSAVRIDIEKRMDMKQTGTFSIDIILEGKGKISFDDGEAAIKKGDEIFMPAALHKVSWTSEEGRLTIIRCFPPGVF